LTCLDEFTAAFAKAAENLQIVAFSAFSALKL
jgi:hypothetical protein